MLLRDDPAGAPGPSAGAPDRGVARPEPAGIAAGVGAYSLWGVLTLYWALLAAAGAVEILAHRVVWAMALVGIALVLRRRWAWARELLRHPRALAALALAAVLISVNWGLFIWAATNGHVVDASLGYYINPLVSVLLGVVVLRERLDRVRWAAVALAALGVGWLTVEHGAPPWVSLALAFSFGGYGLLKKLATVSPLESLGVETAVLFLPALGYLIWLGASGGAAFGVGDPRIDLLLIASGLATAVPLVLFGAAAARIPLSTVGMLQYLTPTLQLLIGVLVLGERVSAGQLVGFVLVWAALVLLTIGLLCSRPRSQSVIAGKAPLPAK